jgi:hypothetical protein
MMRLSRRHGATLACTLLLAGGGLAAGPAAAQRPDGAQHTSAAADSEMARLRHAAEQEQAGQLEAATEVVAAVLRDNPTSLTALLTYERLLNVQGRAADVLPAADRLLAEQPASVLAHQVRLRVAARLDDSAAIERAVSAWVQATPQVETPYREAALVWRGRGDGRRALEVLEQGRRRVDRPDALALELGDAWLADGDLRRAAAEWARAVGPEGRGVLLVQRRLQALPDGGAAVIPLLVEQLAGAPRTAGRQRAAVLFAIEAGLEPRAQRLAGELAAMTPAQEREQVLVELARRADGGGLHRLAAWSYGELLRDVRDPAAGLAIRTRVAELALMAGDTALAADVYRQLEAAAATGSPQRREALALRMQLTMREGDLAQAAAQLDTFRAEFPRAPEVDATAARLSLRLLEQGDVAAAVRVLDGVAGPHAARVRGRIHIRAGNIAAARQELMAAAPMLQGREATETIAMVALLSRISPDGGEFVARAVASEPEERRALLAGAVDATRRLPAPERAAVLEFVAAMADASGMGEEAERIRGEIVARMPRSHEAPAAILALARSSLQRSAGDGPGREAAGEEARLLLEKLILEYPRSALAPQARRELEQLQRRSSRP